MAPRRRPAHRAQPEASFALGADPRRGADIALVLFVTFACWNLLFNLAPAFVGGALAAAADVGADWTQWALMPLLAAALFLATRGPAARPRLVRLVLVALAFSFLGDALPDVLDSDGAFYAMLGCFLCAQITYIVAFWPYRGESLGRRRPWTLAVYAAFLAGLTVLVADGAGAMLPAAIVYGCALTAMAVLATGVHWTAGIGAGLFFVSDALIATGRFCDLDLWAFGFWVMATYIAGQLLLAEGVVRRARSSHRAAHAEGGRR